MFKIFRQLQLQKHKCLKYLKDLVNLMTNLVEKRYFSKLSIG